MLAVYCPRSALCEAYVGPMFAYVSRMWPQVGPMLALCWPKLVLCWPKLALSWPYLAPMLALSWPYVASSCRQILPKYVKTPSTCHFFPSGPPPWTPKPRKTRGFLMAPRWNSGTPRATKHRETRRFLTPCAKNTVNYVGSGTGEVTPSWSAAGPARHYNLRLPTEGLRQGHGPRGRRPDFTFWSFRRRPARERLLWHVGSQYGNWFPSSRLGNFEYQYQWILGCHHSGSAKFWHEFDQSNHSKERAVNADVCFLPRCFFLPQLDFEIRHCNERLSKVIKGAERVASHQGKPPFVWNHVI